MYKYYLVGKMEDIGSLPVHGLESYQVYGSKPFIPCVGCRVCGEAVYSRILNEKEISCCHLLRAPDIMV